MTKPTLAAFIGALTLIIVPSTALGASGITPIAPKSGASVPAGASPTFRMDVTGKGQVWVHVCKSRKKDRQGVICIKESIGRALKRSGKRFAYKPKFFDFPGFWLNSPGTYYWQAHRIACEGGTSDCRVEGPIVKFKVV